MKVRTYLSMVSFNRKYAALILLQVIFLSVVGLGVYTFDQQFPDTPVADQSIIGSGVTDDNRIHWLEKTHPDRDEVNPSTLDVQNELIIHTMETSNKISSTKLLVEQNNHISSLLEGHGYPNHAQKYKIQTYQNELLIIVNYKEISQFPILFKISSLDDNPITKTAVIELPNNSSFSDYRINPSTGEIVFSSMDPYVWALWMDISRSFSSFSEDKFFELLGSENYNSSTYLSTINIQDIMWKDISNELPFNSLEIMGPLYQLSWEDSPIDRSIESIGSYRPVHYELINQLDNLAYSDLAEIMNDAIGLPQETEFKVKFPGLYLLTSLKLDEQNRIHGQGWASTRINDNPVFSRADYFIVDINEESLWSWDLTDVALIQSFQSFVKSAIVGDTVFYINHDANLDTRLSEDYPFENYSDFLNYYLNADRDQLQLSWFNPTSAPITNISSLEPNQPNSWIDIYDQNSVFQVQEMYDGEGIFSTFVTTQSDMKVYLDNKGDIHLHYVFGDIPEEFGQEFSATLIGMYSWDFNTANLGDIEQYSGEITTLREQEGDPIDRSFAKNAVTQGFEIRKVGDELDFLYFYAINNDLPIPRIYVMIVSIDELEGY